MNRVQVRTALKAYNARLEAALRTMIARHDKQADEDNPPEGRETGHFTCGCLDCRNAHAVLATRPALGPKEN